MQVWLTSVNNGVWNKKDIFLLQISLFDFTTTVFDPCCVVLGYSDKIMSAKINSAHLWLWINSEMLPVQYTLYLTGRAQGQNDKHAFSIPPVKFIQTLILTLSM